MPFTILPDADVRRLLRTLSAGDIAALLRTLEDALVQYSTQDEKQYQPHRAVVARPDGQVSLFMPATTPQQIGVKIVGISPPVDPATLPPGTNPPPSLKSVLTLCDAAGNALGVLNAAEVTGFRTALGSMSLFVPRRCTENIVVFGAGKQAFWHILLATRLRGEDIRRVTVVNRSAERTQALLGALRDADVPSHIRITAFANTSDDGHDNAQRELEDLLVGADVIFCTTGSKKALFPARFLTSPRAQKKRRYIAAVGSYRLDMMEIDTELLQAVADPSGVFSTHVWKGTVAVDTRDGCVQEAGELVAAGIRPDQMVELGEIQHQQRTAAAPRELGEWLQSGFVVYKSVGTGIMDISVSQKLLALAQSKGVGQYIQDF
ncbi:hypothetical protein VTK73DRAFT_9592 [Phialemonium thermophilum]|uniref:Ornithine cyclodeaminase n=1 Tax=Phialemonium thermophilum TaxID=223376 RepID=A0ABR3W1L2_9PEZI